MKKKDIKKLKEIRIEGEIAIPENWVLIKDPVKITENGIDCFKAVIGSA